MLTEDFKDTIDVWLEALEQYDYRQLCTKPSPHSWSLGQLYIHLITDTKYYIEQIKSCLSTNDNAVEEATPFAKTLFANNGFPDIIIEGHPSNSTIPQPGSKEGLVRDLIALKDEINSTGITLFKSAPKGKTKHPGLGYFNAHEWFQLGEMHFRHHLRQKKKIDDFLETTGS